MKFLTTSVSHQMRNPLQSMNMMSKQLNTYIKSKEGKEIIQTISSCSKVLLVQVNDLLDMNLFDEQQFEERKEIFNIRSEIQDILNTQSGQVLTNNNRLMFAVDPSLTMMIEADLQRITQMTLNYIQNANKFTRNGIIQIYVSMKRVQRTRGYVGDYLCIEVKDTGVGISDEDQKKLFLPFTKLQATLVYNPEGVGLGLHLCKQIAERLDGKVWCHSMVGKGSLFGFSVRMRPIHNQVDPNQDELEQAKELSSGDSKSDIEEDAVQDQSESPRSHIVPASAVQVSEPANVNIVEEEMKRGIQDYEDLAPSFQDPEVCRNESREIKLDYMPNPSKKFRILVADDMRFNIIALKYFFQNTFNF